MANHPEQANPWISFRRTSASTRVHLFCFPYAGAGASVFRPWTPLLPPDIGLYGVQYPGREERLQEKHFNRIEHLTEALVHNLSPWLKGRYAFFGHSVGAIVAYNVVCFLRRKRMPLPCHLFISARRAPQLPPPRELWHELPDPEFIQKIRSMNGIPRELFANTEVQAMLVPLLKADFAIGETYTYMEEAPLGIPVTVFGGIRDTITKWDLLAWRELAKAPFRLHLFPGDHFFVHSSRKELLQAIAGDLKSCQL